MTTQLRSRGASSPDGKSKAAKVKALHEASRKARAAGAKVRGQSNLKDDARQSHTDSIDAINRKLREAAVYKAILRAINEPKQGIDGAMWQQGIVIQVDAATRWFVHRQTLEEILKSLPRKHRPSQSGLSRWLKQIEPHVQAVAQQDAKRAEHTTEMRIARGDLRMAHAILHQMLGEAVCQYLDPETFNDLPVPMKHYVARVAEGQSNALKVQTEADLRTAQRDKLVATLKSIAEGDKGATGEDAKTAARRAYCEALGIPLAEDAPAAAAPPAKGGKP